MIAQIGQACVRHKSSQSVDGICGARTVHGDFLSNTVGALGLSSLASSMRWSIPADTSGIAVRSNQRAARFSSSAANGSPRSSPSGTHGRGTARGRRWHTRSAGDVHPGQPSRGHVYTGFLQHFSHRTVGRVLPWVDDPGHRGPGVVVGPFDQQHLLIADDDGGDGEQPQRCVSHVPTKLDDEFRDRHSPVLTETVTRASQVPTICYAQGAP